MFAKAQSTKCKVRDRRKKKDFILLLPENRNLRKSTNTCVLAFVGPKLSAADIMGWGWEGYGARGGRDVPRAELWADASN